MRLEQRRQGSAAGTRPRRQRRARRVHARSCVDLLQPVVRHVVHEVRHQRVRDESCRGHALVDDLRRHGLLHQLLAALARPLAADVPMHEELGRHDVQPLAHVLADAQHRLAALAGRVLGFVVVFDAAQVLGQRLAARLALHVGECLVRRIGIALQDQQPRGQIGFVLGQRVLEHPTLLSVHRLGARAELPGLQPRELERDALDLRVLEQDLAVPPGDVLVLRGNHRVARVQLLVALGQLREQRGGQLCHGALVQTFEVLGLERVHIEHVPIVGSELACCHRATSNCRARHTFPGDARGARSHARDALHVLQALPG
jgi:hypothetical protein